MKRISIQLVRSYATTRTLVGLFPAVLIPSIIGGWLSTQLTSTNQVTSVVMPGILAGCAIAALVVSPFGELDELHRRPLRSLRMASVLLGLILSGCLFVALGWSVYNVESAGTMLVRTMVGMCGVALIGVRVFGRAAGVLPAAGWGVAAMFSVQPDHGYPAWAWQMQPSGDWLAWAVACSLLVVGASALWNMPFSRGH